MSPTQQPTTYNNGKTDAPDGIAVPQHQTTMPSTGPLDPEALTGIEMTLGRDFNAQQKRDDPYLVCFHETHDAEK